MNLIETIAYRDYPIESDDEGNDINYDQRAAFLFGVNNLVKFFESWGYKKGLNMLFAEYFDDNDN